MTDYIVRATVADGQIRAFAAYTKDVVEEARRRHNTSPTADGSIGTVADSWYNDGSYDEE